jgi:hypothetical protein
MIMEESNRIKAVLIHNSNSLEKAVHYAYDVGKKLFGCEVEIRYHVECSYGHIFLVSKRLVGEKGLVGKREKN